MRKILSALAVLAALIWTQASFADYKAPRAPDGKKPDFNGIWQALNEAHWDVERHMARSSVEEREGPRGPVPSAKTVHLGAVVSVPGSMGVVEGGTIPYTEEALAKRDENRANYLERDPEVKCFLPGIPRSTYMPYPFQIFQSDNEVFIAHEYAAAVRNIYANDPGEAPIDSWMGQSVLSWDGDTMVLTTTGQVPDTWLDRAGNHHSELLKVVERFTLTGPDHIHYEATLTDPQVYTKPWTMSMPLYRRLDRDTLMDFKCVEFVEELMYGKWRRHPFEGATGVER